VHERARAASLRDAEWQSQLASRGIAAPGAATHTAADGISQDGDFDRGVHLSDTTLPVSVEFARDDAQGTGHNELDGDEVLPQHHQQEHPPPAEFERVEVVDSPSKIEPAVAPLVEQDEKVNEGSGALPFGPTAEDGRSSRQDSGDGHDTRSLTDDQADPEPHFESDASCDSGASAAGSKTLRRPAGRRDRAASGVRKIRRRRLTKEEEARFAPEELRDLKGTTAAKSRKMSASERDVMLHKRRLRNRESAARSREKQRKTINELSDEMGELLAVAHVLKLRAASAETEAEVNRDRLDQVSAKYESAIAEIERLRNENRQLSFGSRTLTVQGATKLQRSISSSLHLAFSGDMPDKAFGANQMTLYPIGGAIVSETAAQGVSQSILPNPAAQSPRQTPGLLRIPSSMQLSLSSDKLDSLVFQSLPRNFSFVDRLLGESNVGPFVYPACSLQGYAQLGGPSSRPPLSSYSGIPGNLQQS
jgi:hypothetical protein